MDQNIKEAGAREKILAAAIKTFKDRGYDKTSMKDIAQEAGVNKALLFYYFNSKENLFQEIIKNMFEKFLQGLEEKQHEIGEVKSVEERFYRLMELYTDQFTQTRDIIYLVMQGILQSHTDLPSTIVEMMQKVRQPLVDILKEGMEQGVFRQMDPYFTSVAIIGVFQIFYRMPCKLAPSFDDREVFHNTLNFTLNGILARSENL